MIGSVELSLVEQLFEGLPENPFFVKDAELRYVAANAAMRRLCGAATRRSMIGKRAESFFPARLAARYEVFDRQVIASGRAITNNLDLSAGAGRRAVWLVFARLPVRDAEGRVVGVAASARELARPDRQHPTYQRLDRVAQRIRRRFDRPLDLGDLARDAGISASQLERDFARVFAMPPQEFHQRMRIEHALALLETGQSVAEVAHACGYSDHSAFTRRFRALVGMSPREWRRHSQPLGAPAR